MQWQAIASSCVVKGMLADVANWLALVCGRHIRCLALTGGLHWRGYAAVGLGMLLEPYMHARA